MEPEQENPSPTVDPAVRIAEIYATYQARMADIEQRQAEALLDFRRELEARKIRNLQEGLHIHDESGN
jgi:hypothetical protein